MLMQAIFTTTILFSGTAAVSSVTFETLDEKPCAATARAVLGPGAVKKGVEWVIKTDAGYKTLVCVPYQDRHKDE